MDSQHTIHQDIAAIKERNLRVETEKAWETSWTRMILLAMLTYIVCAILFFSLGTPSPLLNALIPTAGYALSVQSLPIVKQWWIANYQQKNR